MADEYMNWATQIANGVGALASAIGTRKEMERQYNYNRKLMKLQSEYNEQAAINSYQRQLDFYGIQNEYNDPSNVRKRYEAAGVNPYAAFGTAGSYTPAQQSASVPDQAGVGLPSTSLGPRPAFDPLDAILRAAQIRNINADTDKKRGDTLDPDETKRGQKLTNKLKELGIINQEIANESDSLDLQFQNDVYDVKVKTEEAKLKNIVKQYQEISARIAESVMNQHATAQQMKESASRIALNTVNAALAQTQNEWYGKMAQAQIAELQQNVLLKVAQTTSANWDSWVKLAQTRELTSQHFINLAEANKKEYEAWLKKNEASFYSGNLGKILFGIEKATGMVGKLMPVISLIQ